MSKSPIVYVREKLAAAGFRATVEFVPYTADSDAHLVVKFTDAEKRKRSYSLQLVGHYTSARTERYIVNLRLNNAFGDMEGVQHVTIAGETLAKAVDSLLANAQIPLPAAPKVTVTYTLGEIRKRGLVASYDRDTGEFRVARKLDWYTGNFGMTKAQAKKRQEAQADYQVDCRDAYFGALSMLKATYNELVARRAKRAA